MNTGMKASTIKQVLRKKLNNWFDTIDDPIVKEVAQENTIVSGGAISSMLLGEKPNDYDIYFKTYKAALLIATYYTTKFNESNKIKSLHDYRAEIRTKTITNIKGIAEDRIQIYLKSAGVAAEEQDEYDYFELRPEHEQNNFIDSIVEKLQENSADTVEEVVQVLKEKGNYRPIFLTDNAITLSNKVQLIIRFYGDIDGIHSNFDYAHCMSSYDYHSDKLVLPPEALEALISRTLVYKGSLYPIASIFRIRKFIQRGFRISAGQLLKIVWQINELDLKNMEVLQEQLIGVDVAYMRQLIDRIQDEKPSKIDSTYIAELIDEVFG